MDTKYFEQLTPDNAAMLLIDHQVGTMAFGITDLDPVNLRNNALWLAEVATVFNLPTILATSNADGANGPEVFDTKTTQLILFGMLIHAGNPAAKFHAIAAHRAGASWEELQKVVELAAATAASGPMNQGGSVLKELRENYGKS